MDNSFSLYRVGLLIKRQWASFGKIFLVTLGAITLILLGFYLYNLPAKGNIYTFHADKNGEITLLFPIPLFCIIGLLFVTLSSSWYFSKWGKKANTIEELLLPASNIEKALCSVVLTSIVCIGGYLIVFLLIDSGYRIYLNEFVKTVDPKIKVSPYMDDNQRLSIRDCHAQFFVKIIDSQFFWPAISIGFLLQSIFLLGSIYFKRFQYIKTLITIAITGFVIIFSTFKLGSYLNESRVIVYHTLDELDHKNDSIPIFIYVIVLVLTLIFYWITYLRVKEKEV
ncbi:MAG: hypothetical protein DI598_12270 [Pseudopedobacter saltans]|uniref:Uncharacterized protein n=1 Tax=Pseudopedobacter saltans TaxID=151895 RepID=A0A2W5GWD1_9SPHI|nr:MAG: hypothetical protein DI598_12270 [Pseudopedobacter saltans]